MSACVSARGYQPELEAGNGTVGSSLCRPALVTAYFGQEGRLMGHRDLEQGRFLSNLPGQISFHLTEPESPALLSQILVRNCLLPPPHFLR